MLWRAGMLAVVWAALLGVVALLRPLAPGGSSPWLRLSVTLAIGLGVAGSAVLASLKTRGQAAVLAFYAFLVLALDALGQVVGPHGWPDLAAHGAAGGRGRGRGRAAPRVRRGGARDAPGRGRRGRRLLHDLEGGAGRRVRLPVARVRDPPRAALREAAPRVAAGGAGAADVGHRPARRRLRRLAAHPRAGASCARRRRTDARARQLDRAAELDAALDAPGRGRALRHRLRTRSSTSTSTASATPRSCAPPTARRSCASRRCVPLTADPFAFVLDRRQPFYATDFKRLLWSLPYFRDEVRIGSLLAMPVLHGRRGRRRPDRPQGRDAVAHGARAGAAGGLRGDGGRGHPAHARVALPRGAGRRVQGRLRGLAATDRDHERPGDARASCCSSALSWCRRSEAARDRASSTIRPRATRSSRRHGWAQEFEGREVALVERTWASWVLRSAEEAVPAGRRRGRQGADAAPRAGRRLGPRRNRCSPCRSRRGSRRSERARADRPPREPSTPPPGACWGSSPTRPPRCSSSSIAQEDAEGAGRARRADRPLQPPRVRRAARSSRRARQDRQKRPFALLLFDIDHFKKLNDTYGHPAGDAALRSTAQVFERQLRKGDQAARYGGEEFAAILPGTDEAGAAAARRAAARRRSRRRARSSKARGSASRSAWASRCGPADAQDEEGLIAAADRALYAAKQGGRNRVVTASSLPPADSSPSH